MSDLEESFTFWMPAQVVSKANPTTGKTQRVIQGIASTCDMDLQGETVDQLGIDYSYFKEFGYFNDDHKQGNEFRVGEPTDVKLTKDGLFVKGIIYEGKNSSDAVWEHMNTLDKNKSRRRMGFSIEGKIVQKAGTSVKKCWLQNVAVTAAPVNTKTWAEIVKSLTSKCDVEEKALAVGDGHPLVPESLEREEKPSLEKGLTMEQVTELVKSETGLDLEGATDVARIIFATFN